MVITDDLLYGMYKLRFMNYHIVFTISGHEEVSILLK